MQPHLLSVACSASHRDQVSAVHHCIQAAWHTLVIMSALWEPWMGHFQEVLIHTKPAPQPSFLTCPSLDTNGYPTSSHKNGGARGPPGSSQPPILWAEEPRTHPRRPLPSVRSLQGGRCPALSPQRYPLSCLSRWPAFHCLISMLTEQSVHPVPMDFTVPQRRQHRNTRASQ